MASRVGIDLVCVEEVADAIGRHDRRYLDRVCTPHELAACAHAGPGRLAARVAARFAAKEAVLKVLEPDADTAIPWNAIEVHAERSRGVEISLSGPAAALAERRGVGPLHASVATERGHVLAVVVAQERSECAPSTSRT
jgi:holo-[acyl-carrier protein] synthase